MKKELSTLLLIFIATVGLSTAVSAAHATQTIQAPINYAQGHMTCYWIPLKTIQVHIPPQIWLWRIWIMRHYPPPVHRFTSNKQNILTIWKRICSTSKPISTPYRI